MERIAKRIYRIIHIYMYKSDNNEKKNKQKLKTKEI